MGWTCDLSRSDLAVTDVRCAVVLAGRAVLFPTAVFADCVFEPYPAALYTPERPILDDYRIGDPASAVDTLSTAGIPLRTAEVSSARL
ncbi:MAG TPA: hypothetical protein VML95_00185 [Longimicrobiales bacterium]|nr:hypothetical protein [Longimicrobiales bacterium]